MSNEIHRMAAARDRRGLEARSTSGDADDRALALAYLAGMSLLDSDFALSLKLARRSLELSPVGAASSRALAVRAKALLRLNRAHEAHSAANDAVVRAKAEPPALVNALNVKASVYWENWDFRSALAVYREALAVESSDRLPARVTAFAFGSMCATCTSELEVAASYIVDGREELSSYRRRSSFRDQEGLLAAFEEEVRIAREGRFSPSVFEGVESGLVKLGRGERALDVAESAVRAALHAGSFAEASRRAEELSRRALQAGSLLLADRANTLRLVGEVGQGRHHGQRDDSHVASLIGLQFDGSRAVAAEFLERRGRLSSDHLGVVRAIRASSLPGLPDGASESQSLPFLGDAA